ncbi:hypothetical protein BKA82DRAFT_23439 [Pisolithus tinctorius]|uniref:Uncharacterized protein n=1 Tax=Pisolithus tinctorius Marx 270 TaxID=870435 RepID=A0A0C3PGN8_PISTI|nr:hypothetical protein BKA82DRAFT_23439 [Pisolithus tinctorius]KIO07551.1 hypothetical protein M404DRAFT_23439 [Pisolithus tinctorius Marx 270]
MPKQTVQQNKPLLKIFEILAANAELVTLPRQGTLVAGGSDFEHIQQAGTCARLDSIPQQVKPLFHLFSNHKKILSSKLEQAVGQYQLKHKTATNMHRVQANALGLKDNPPTHGQLQAQGVKVISRNHADDLCYNCGTTLVDVGNEDLITSTLPALAVPVDTTWYIVPAGEGGIFLNDGGNGDVELAILHGYTAAWPALVDYVNEVITQAVSDQCNCHPNHCGTLVQYEWNTGAHHAHAFGPVCNIKRKLSGEEQEEHDRQILGVFALSWNLLAATLPKEVINPTHAAISAAGLPAMASQGNVQGQLPAL